MSDTHPNWHHPHGGGPSYQLECSAWGCECKEPEGTKGEYESTCKNCGHGVQSGSPENDEK